LYILPTECINLFYIDLRINRDYFLILLTGFVTEMMGVYCAVRAELLNIIQVNLNGLNLLYQSN
jgi:hypothetical protein